MKQQSYSLRHRTTRHPINPDGLSGCQTNDSTFIKIIFSLAVIHRNAYCFYQKQGIKTECHLVRSLVFRMVKMNDVDLRMAGLLSKKLIILLNRIGLYYTTHHTVRHA